MKRILLSTIVISSLLTAFACQPGGGGDKVKVGVFMSMTGDTANFGISSVNGIKMATDEANAAGGINGKQIELDVQDDRSDPSEAATIVTAQFEGLPKPPYAIAYVRLDGVSTALLNFVQGEDLSDVPAAAARLKPGTRVRVAFVSKPEGRITDFHYVLLQEKEGRRRKR